MKNSARSFGLAVVVLCLMFGASGQARASIIFDNSGEDGGPNGRTFRPQGDLVAPGTFISNVASNTTITNIEVLNTLDVAQNLKFLIFDNSNGNLLYQSAPQVFAQDLHGDTWKQSAAFSFTLLAGQQYDIGVVQDGTSSYPYIYPSTGFTQNGISSGPGNNANFGPYANPAEQSRGLADIPLRLDGGPAAVPEPATNVVVIIAGLMGAGYSWRRRNRAAA